MNSAPLVSIIIPAFDSRFFSDALDSALAQRYENLEIIICDDSRGDDISAIVKALEPLPATLRHVRNPRTLGFAANLLTSLSEAQGEFIKFLCDDDLLYPECVLRQAHVLREHRDVTLVVAQRRFWDSDDIQLPDRLENTPLTPVSARLKSTDLLSLFESYPRNLLGGLSGALMRREDVIQVLPQLVSPANSFVRLLDLAIYVELLTRGDAVMLQQVLSVERLHAHRLSSQSSTHKRLASESRRMVDRLAAHQREAPPVHGWLRYRELTHDHGQTRHWQELHLGRILGSLRATLPFQVGVESESFGQLYREWLACRTLSQADRMLLPGIVASWPKRPAIVVVVVDEQGSDEVLALTLASIAGQAYPAAAALVLSAACAEPTCIGQTLYIPAEGGWFSQLNAVLGEWADADWFYLLRAGDRLVESALLMMAERIATSSDVLWIYSDEGNLTDGVSSEPIFKPDFNLDFLRSYPYVGRTLAFERNNFMQLGGFDESYVELAPHDMLWRTVETHGFAAVGHIAEVIVETQLAFGQWLSMPQVIEQSPRVVHAHLERMGVPHAIGQGVRGAINVIDYLHPHTPMVSIIIIHNDQLAALQRCIETLLEKTTYGFYELLIVDTGSVDGTTLGWLAGMAELGGDKIRVMHTAPDAHETAVRNLAASRAVGEYLLMLSPYAVITHGGWLQALLEQAQRPEVGVVGGKLFSSTGNILHAGLILGLQGCVGSAFFAEAGAADGYMTRLQTVLNPSAVSQDCLMVRSQVYQEVGGLNEVAFQRQLGVIDLCIRIRQHGYMIVWTPSALLTVGTRPMSMASEKSDAQHASDMKAFYLRWLPLLARDPAYNINLQLGSGSFALHEGERSGWTPFADRRLPVVLGMPINTSGVGGYRVAQPFRALEAAGLAVGRLSYAAQPSIIQIERQSPSIIVLQGRYTAESIRQIEPLQTYSRARLIYELDDYVISIPSKNGHVRGMPADLQRLVAEGVGLCDRMVVSTQPLADALSTLHHDIRVVPNTLAPQVWTGLKSTRGTSSRPRVGWGGGTSHGGDLAVIAAVVRELAGEVDWIFFGMCPSELRPYLHEFHAAVDFEAYPAKLSSLNLDLALAPLEFHIFNDCKSNLRLLEYGACGYPVIVSDTQAYRGELPCTRVQSNTTEEWLRAIRMHLADPEASCRMGDQLHQMVMRDCLLQGDNLQRWVHAWLAD